MRCLRIPIFLTMVCVVGLPGVDQPAPLRLAALGDSLTAGPREGLEPVAGRADLTWISTLQLAGLVDAGPWQMKRDKRPAGYERVWAEWGVTCTGVLAKGWLDGLCALSGQVDAVVVHLGHNELLPFVQEDLPKGRTPDPARVATIVATYRLELAAILDRLVLAHGRRVLVVLPCDWNTTHLVASYQISANLTKEMRVIHRRMRQATLEAALVRDLPTVDAHAVIAPLVEPWSTRLAGLTIANRSATGEALCAYQTDTIHFTTLYNGLVARDIFAALRPRRAGAPDDQTLLRLAGLAGQVLAH